MDIVFLLLIGNVLTQSGSDEIRCLISNHIPEIVVIIFILYYHQDTYV